MAVKKAAAPKKASAAKSSTSKAASNFYRRITPKVPASQPSQSPSGRPTKKGRTPRNEPDTFEKNLVFVGMSFVGDGMTEVFSAIRDVCTSLKLKARRVDDNHTSGFIILEIIDLIERAEFLVFDLTFERPNVYYELGYAHGVGNAPSNILLIAKEGTSTHFDISPLRIHYYPNTEKLRQTLKAALKTLIASTRVS
jgi:hypothetical protein